jgi:hypothetical protein
MRSSKPRQTVRGIEMFRYTLIVLLAVFSRGVLAEETKDTIGIYEDLRQSLKPSTGATVDEMTTATIKRHMATLLYPVDLSSLKPPEQDEAFKALIKILQRQMGDPDTGLLTASQFYRLSDAARDIDAAPVLVSGGKIVSMENGLVLAVGTGKMDDIADPINKVRIVCLKSEGTCNETEATFNLKTHLLDLFDVASYKIQTWTSNRLTAFREHPCGTATMSIDLVAKTVEVGVLGHKDFKFCSDDPSGRWTLVDSFPVGWNIARDKQIKALEFAYPPSRKFFSLLQPISATRGK